MGGGKSKKSSSASTKAISDEHIRQYIQAQTLSVCKHPSCARANARGLELAARFSLGDAFPSTCSDTYHKAHRGFVCLVDGCNSFEVYSESQVDRKLMSHFKNDHKSYLLEMESARIASEEAAAKHDADLRIEVNEAHEAQLKAINDAHDVALRDIQATLADAHESLNLMAEEKKKLSHEQRSKLLNELAVDVAQGLTTHLLEQAKKNRGHFDYDAMASYSHESYLRDLKHEHMANNVLTAEDVTDEETNCSLMVEFMECVMVHIGGTKTTLTTPSQKG